MGHFDKGHLYSWARVRRVFTFADVIAEIGRNTLEIFVSYSHKDKELAGKIGKLLDKAGQTPFLAHDDIKPTEDWEEEIMKRLDTCSALVAVITPNFVGSAYANQEVGLTMGRGKTVIPLRLGES